MRTRLIGVIVLVVTVAACGDDAGSAEPERPEVDPVTEWCIDYRVTAAYFDTGNADDETLAELEALAQRGITIDDPAVSGPSAALFDGLTTTGSDPAVWTGALVELRAVCRRR